MKVYIVTSHFGEEIESVYLNKDKAEAKLKQLMDDDDSHRSYDPDYLKSVYNIESYETEDDKTI